MSADRELHEKMSLRKSLFYAGISRRMWYHKPKAREIGRDLDVVVLTCWNDGVKQIVHVDCVENLVKNQFLPAIP